MSQSQPQPQPQLPQHGDVIDLTEDSTSPPSPFTLPRERSPDLLLRRPGVRLPQGTSVRQAQHTEDVIDLSEADDVPKVTSGRQSSPDVQFLSSRTRSRSLSLGGYLDRAVGARPPRGGQIAEQQYSPWPNRPQLPSIQNTLRQATFNGNLTQHFHARDELVGWEGFGVGGHFELPNMLDIQAIGFDLDHPHRHVPPSTLSPTYDAPPPPRGGFTRSPKEHDFLVCPNCEDELGVGEDEAKRQVWIVKACGHVGVLM